MSVIITKQIIFQGSVLAAGLVGWLVSWLALRIVPMVPHMPNTGATNQLQSQLIVLIFSNKFGLKSGTGTYRALLESGLRLSCGLRWRSLSFRVITVTDTMLKFTNLFHCSPRTHT